MDNSTVIILPSPEWFGNSLVTKALAVVATTLLLVLSAAEDETPFDQRVSIEAIMIKYITSINYR